MRDTPSLARHLTHASVAKRWVPEDLVWPEDLDRTVPAMSPELTSLYGTEAWDRLDGAQRDALCFWELVNLFSVILHGERMLVIGMCEQIDTRHGVDLTQYLHHFIDEENKHMVLFGTFCHRYGGKVYPWKKLALPQSLPRAEADIRFFLRVLVIEEIGIVYNERLAHDARLPAIVRQINRIHLVDESRHLAFGRAMLRDLVQAARLDDDALGRTRKWLASYLRASWADFANPAMYADAGLPDPYGLSDVARGADAGRQRRTELSAPLVQTLLDAGVLLEPPAL